MKQIVVGIGVYLSGILLLCADYIVREIVYSIPGVTVVYYSNLMRGIGIAFVFGGILLIAFGSRKN